MTDDRVSHDVVRVHDTCVMCRCGRWFDGDTLTQARDLHEKHHGLEAAHAAIASGTVGDDTRNEAPGERPRFKNQEDLAPDEQA